MSELFFEKTLPFDCISLCNNMTPEMKLQLYCDAAKKSGCEDVSILAPFLAMIFLNDGAGHRLSINYTADQFKALISECLANSSSNCEDVVMQYGGTMAARNCFFCKLSSVYSQGLYDEELAILKYIYSFGGCGSYVSQLFKNPNSSALFKSLVDLSPDGSSNGVFVPVFAELFSCAHLWMGVESFDSFWENMFQYVISDNVYSDGSAIRRKPTPAEMDVCLKFIKDNIIVSKESLFGDDVLHKYINAIENRNDNEPKKKRPKAKKEVSKRPVEKKEKRPSAAKKKDSSVFDNMSLDECASLLLDNIIPVGAEKISFGVTEKPMEVVNTSADKSPADSKADIATGECIDASANDEHILENDVKSSNGIDTVPADNLIVPNSADADIPEVSLPVTGISPVDECVAEVPDDYMVTDVENEAELEQTDCGQDDCSDAVDTKGTANETVADSDMVNDNVADDLFIEEGAAVNDIAVESSTVLPVTEPVDYTSLLYVPSACVYLALSSDDFKHKNLTILTENSLLNHVTAVEMEINARDVLVIDAVVLDGMDGVLLYFDDLVPRAFVPCFVFIQNTVQGPMLSAALKNTNKKKISFSPIGLQSYFSDVLISNHYSLTVMNYVINGSAPTLATFYKQVDASIYPYEYVFFCAYGLYREYLKHIEEGGLLDKYKMNLNYISSIAVSADSTGYVKNAYIEFTGSVFEYKYVPAGTEALYIPGMIINITDIELDMHSPVSVDAITACVCSKLFSSRLLMKHNAKVLREFSDGMSVYVPLSEDALTFMDSLTKIAFNTISQLTGFKPRFKCKLGGFLAR